MLKSARCVCTSSETFLTGVRWSGMMGMGIFFMNAPEFFIDKCIMEFHKPYIGLFLVTLAEEVAIAIYII